MSEATRIADLLHHVLEGEPWHADNLTTLLEGITAKEAATHHAAGTHTIVELVLHMTGWADEVRSRLEGGLAGTPPQGDWPDPGDVTPARWTAACEALVSTHRRLIATVRGLSAEALARPVRDERGDGAGATGYQTANGIIHHSVYHAGQIAMVKKAVTSSA